MGLIKEGDKFVVLTDIQGAEDHLGDMDFKVTGTDAGITALQMDIKIKGITVDILKIALAQAQKARLQILEKMREAIPSPRPEISPYAPRVYTMQIKQDKIGLLIGSGGRTIRSIIGSTDSEINIDPDGKVYITAPNEKVLQTILDRINELLAEPEEGKVYDGVVVEVKDFGALVQILPNYIGLLHISQISDKYVKDIKKEIHIGDKVRVKVLKIENDGKIVLSKKALEQNTDTGPHRRERKEE